jgi:hypothetical protein
LLERLTQSGHLHWINTGGDGRYLLHAYLDEPVPTELVPYTRDPVEVARFRLPTGRLYFTGGECAFRTDDSFLQRHPGMGGCANLPPGDYRLTLYRTEYPDRLQDAHFRRRVSVGAFWLHQSLGLVAAAGVAAFVLLLTGLFFADRQTWLRYYLPIAGIFVVLPFVIARLKPYRQAQAAYEAIQREYPSIIAQLESQGGAAATA